MFGGQTSENVHDVHKVCLRKRLSVLRILMSFTRLFCFNIIGDVPYTQKTTFNGLDSGYDPTYDPEGALEKDPKLHWQCPPMRENDGQWSNQRSVNFPRRLEQQGGRSRTQLELSFNIINPTYGPSMDRRHPLIVLPKTAEKLPMPWVFCKFTPSLLLTHEVIFGFILL